MPRDDQAIPASLELRCTNCGYCLTGLIERRCPECGQAFDPGQTWRENEQATWSYHFENVRTPGGYLCWATLGTMVLAFMTLAARRPAALLALPAAVLCEMLILWAGGPGLRLRLGCWAVAVAWGIVVQMLW